MSALDEVRRRHAQELQDAEIEARRELQLSPEDERSALEEGVRMARDVLEAELPITEQPVAKVEAEVAALEAELELLELLPQKRARALRHLTEAAAAAEQAFDAEEFLEPVSAERLAQLAALQVAGSRAFRGELGGRLKGAFDQEGRPERAGPDWQPRMVVVQHRLVELRGELHRRKSEARSAERASARSPRKGRLRAAVGGALRGAPADDESDEGYKGPVADPHGGTS